MKSGFKTRLPNPDLAPRFRMMQERRLEKRRREEKVNHPRHYNAHPSGVECITVVEHMGFNLGNAVKYLWRADEKGAPIEDLKKARWYIDREIQRRKKQQG